MGRNTGVPLASRLLTHARLYGFADRFNIPALRSCTFNKLVATLDSLGSLEGPENVLAVIEYAFDNLPSRATGERLLDYLRAYGAWTLEVLRKEQRVTMRINTRIVKYQYE